MIPGRGPDTLEELRFDLNELVCSIEICRSGHHYLGAMILAYALIDSLGWLISESDAREGVDFRAWAEKYVSLEKLGVTAEELWANRCGLMHTFSPESRRRRAIGTRQIILAIRSEIVESSRRSIPESGLDDQFVAIQTTHFLKDVQEGFLRFFTDLEGDEDATQRALKRAREYYGFTPTERVPEALRQQKGTQRSSP